MGQLEEPATTRWSSWSSRRRTTRKRRRRRGGREGWIVEFEFAGKVLMRDRNAFVVVKRGENEPRFSTKELASRADEVCPSKADALSILEMKSEQEFVSMSKEEIKSAERVKIELGKNEHIVWDILAEDEALTGGEVFDAVMKNLQNGPSLRKDPPVVLDDKRHHNIFFEYFWPSMVGFAKRMDRFFSNEKNKLHLTYKRRNIKFDDPTDPEDRDWKLKQCVLIMIAAANEPCCGEENYFKKGHGDEGERLHGRTPYPDFGRYVDQHEFHLFKYAIPRMWADESLWYLDWGKEPWEMLQPFIDAWNATQMSVFEIDPEKGSQWALVTDESFSWRVPKASKTGGMPNHNYEPRKPRGLGHMLKDAAIAAANAIVYNEACMNSEHQFSKDFAKTKSLLPGREHQFINDGTAYVLRQCLAAKMPKSIVGDAGFGSVEAVLHLQKDPRLPAPVEWAFVVKQMNAGYPASVMTSILKARHGTDLCGKWVVLQTEIKDVEVVAVAYAWGADESRISYFVASSANTFPSDIPHETAFQDSNDEMQVRVSPQPTIAHFVYSQLPVIDEHNNKRQGELNLEASWPTKDSWFRVVTTFLGMSVTNQRNVLEFFDVSEKTVREEANIIANGLRLRKRPEITKVASLPDGARLPPRLVRIQKEIGHDDLFSETHKALTEEQQKKQHRMVGSAIQRTCFVCRRYYQKKVDTAFECSDCGTPLCHLNRCSTDSKRTMSCWKEHLKSPHDAIRCNAGMKKTVFPHELKLVNWKDPRDTNM